MPTGAFVQFASSPRTDAFMGGLIKSWTYKYEWHGGTLTGYWEVAIGRWRSRVNDSGPDNAWVSQVGLTPVFRYSISDSSRLFLESGVGANLLVPVYRSEQKSFSTVFNFGDHLAIGWKLGDRKDQEIALRVQHFSNAGIKHPNPGENFVQLRYSWQMH